VVPTTVTPPATQTADLARPGLGGAQRAWAIRPSVLFIRVRSWRRRSAIDTACGGRRPATRRSLARRVSEVEPMPLLLQAGPDLERKFEARASSGDNAAGCGLQGLVVSTRSCARVVGVTRWSPSRDWWAVRWVPQAWFSRVAYPLDRFGVE
jgi:hypothetical protein